MWLRIKNFKTAQGAFSAAWLSKVMDKEVRFPNLNMALLEIPKFVEGDIEKLLNFGIATEKYLMEESIVYHQLLMQGFQDYRIQFLNGLKKV